MEGNSTRLEYMDQYRLDRDIFCKIVSETTGCDILLNAFDYNEFNQSLNFVWFKDEGEYYIVHKNSGMMVNWYKHLGRTNTCSQSFRSIDDYYEFFRLFKEELVEWAENHHYR